MDKWMFNVHESISSPCHFQGDTLLDDDGCLHSIYEKIMSVLSSSGSDGKLSTVYHYHFAAIQYGAIIVNCNYLKINNVLGGTSSDTLTFLHTCKF